MCVIYLLTYSVQQHQTRLYSPICSSISISLPPTMPYWNPLRLTDGRRPNPQMPDNGDFTIPLVLWHSILMLVAEWNVQDALNCRLVCKTFRNLIDDYGTYAVIDMGMNLFSPGAIFLPPGHAENRALFDQRCLDAGHPLAVFRYALAILKDSGNLPLCLKYLRIICVGNRPPYLGVHRFRHIGYQLAFYVLTMFDIILGPEPVRSSSIRSLINDGDSVENMYWIREEVHETIFELSGLHRELMSHIPMRGFPFLPQQVRCEECGEWRYRRHDFRDGHWVNGDYTLGRCCDNCLCYVDAASFIVKLRQQIPLQYRYPNLVPGLYRDWDNLY